MVVRRHARWRGWHAGMLVLVLATVAGLLPASAAALSNFTWSGQAPPNNPFWSAPANWSGHSVPSGSVGKLIFPKLGGGCSPTSSPKTCYSAGNDIPGLSAQSISIDDLEGYTLGGDGISLGAGGITAASGLRHCPCGSTSLFLPIALTASQTWSMDGGASGGAFLTFFGAVTGSAQPLHIEMKNGVQLNLKSMEVGPVTITSPVVAREFVFSNGVLVGQPGHAGGSLNGTDAEPVTLSNVTLASPNSGPLSVSHHAVLWDAGFQPAGSLTVNGTVTFDSSSEVLVYVTHAGSTPGTDYWQLRASGNVQLGGTHLVLSTSNKNGYGPNQPCPKLHAGDVETLVSTTGSIQGKFEGVNRTGGSTGPIANGAKVEITCRAKNPPKVRLNYHAHSVTGTVL